MSFRTSTYSSDACSSPMCACHWPKIDATPQSKLTILVILQSFTQKWLPYAFNLWYLSVIDGGQLNASMSRSSMAILKCQCACTTSHTHCVRVGKLVFGSTFLSYVSFFSSSYLLNTGQKMKCTFKIGWKFIIAHAIATKLQLILYYYRINALY